MKIKSLALAILLFCTTFIPLYSEKISFRADSMTGSTSESNQYTKLSGTATIKTESMDIDADTIELSGKNFRFITANGNVKGKNKDSGLNFVCNEMRYDRETKIASLIGDVHLVDEKNNLTADAQLIDYNSNTDSAVLQISVLLIQDDNVCTSSYAVYQKESQQLFLSGNPEVQQGSDKFRAQEIRLNLKTNEVTLDGRVRGTVTAEQKAKKAPDAKEAPPTPR